MAVLQASNPEHALPFSREDAKLAAPEAQPCVSADMLGLAELLDSFALCNATLKLHFCLSTVHSSPSEAGSLCSCVKLNLSLSGACGSG